MPAMSEPEHLAPSADEDLGLDELGWLLSLASARRRKIAKSEIRQRPGQSYEEFVEVSERHARSFAWARNVEDHLILLLAEEGPEGRAHLRDHHLERLAILERAAA